MQQSNDEGDLVWKKVPIEDINWKSATVWMVVEARSIWIQPRMYGVTLEAREIYVFGETESNPDLFEDSDGE